MGNSNRPFGFNVTSGNPFPVDIKTDSVGIGGGTQYSVDTAAGATDTGTVALAKHVEDQVHLTTADGDYDFLTLDSLGSLHVNAESHHVFDSFNATTGWTALGNDTLNLATTKKHVSGTDALTFDKVNGAANTVFAGIQKTLSSVDLGAVSPHDLLQGTFYIPDLTDVDYVFLRLGTDSSNYNEWRLPDTALTAATFETGAQSIGDVNYAGITGDGWNPSAITYIAVGVAFDAEANTLAGIIFDEISYHTSQHTSAIIGSEVTSEVSSANVNLQKIGGSPTDKDAGNASVGSQRVVIADDDTNLSAIKTAVEILDNAISGSEMQVDVVATATNFKYSNISITASGSTALVTAVAGTRMRCVSAFLVGGSASKVKFTTTAGATLSGELPFAANGGMTLPFNPAGWFQTVTGQGIYLSQATGSVNIGGAITYVEV